jgi:hypothetical protein
LKIKAAGGVSKDCGKQAGGKGQEPPQGLLQYVIAASGAESLIWSGSQGELNKHIAAKKLRGARWLETTDEMTSDCRQSDQAFCGTWQGGCPEKEAKAMPGKRSKRPGSRSCGRASPESFSRTRLGFVARRATDIILVSKWFARSSERRPSDPTDPSIAGKREFTGNASL